MADIPIDAIPRRVQFTGNTGLGPFAFTFNILAAADIAVYKNATLLTITTDYTVSLNANGTGSVTLTGAGSGTALVAADYLTIIGDLPLARTTDFTTAGDLLASALNDQLDASVVMTQQISERVDRALRQDPNDVDGDMTIPEKADRLGKYLKFNDTTGNPEAGSIAGAYTAAGMNNYNFTGDGATVNFTLGMEPGGENNTQVYIDGVYQQKDGYNVSGAVVQFSVAPPNLSTIEVMVIEVLPVGATTASQVSFTQAGSTYGRNVQLKLQESVSVADFGAIGDGSTDDTVAIQAAVNAGRVVHFDSLTYKIAGTILVPDNTHILGSFGTKLLGIMTPEGTGGYPNQMFKNSDVVSGNENITFSNINFDFAKGSYNYDSGAGLTSINSLYFKLVNRLHFENCTFFDFVTNYNTSLSGEGLLAFGMAQFNTCENVSFHRIRSENIREEGFNFWKCAIVVFNNWRADGAAVNTSSHAGIWYCNTVSIRDAKFVHTGGSLLNICSRDVLIENVRVNVGQTQDGRGIDFGNEIDAESFDIANITVNNCDLNVQDYGITIQDSSFEDIAEAVAITNNRFLIGVNPTSLDSKGIGLRNVRAGDISNNYIEMADVTVATAGRCIAPSLSTSVAASGFSTNLTISGNYMRGLSGINFQINANTSIDGVYAKDNTFISQNIGALSSYSGASVFFFLRNNTGAVASFEMSNVILQNNNARNLGGGGIVMSLDEPTDVQLSNMQVVGNRFSGPDGGSTNMDRGFVIRSDGGGTADVRFDDNIIEYGNVLNLLSLKEFRANNNIWRWDTALAADRVSTTDHVGTFEFTNNRMYYVNGSYFDVKQGTGCTFDIVNLTGNASKNTGGTLVFTTDMPANTTLPN